MRYVRAAGARAAPRGRVVERQLPRRCSPRPTSAICSRRRSTASSPEREHLRGKPAPDTFLAGARALGLEPRAAAVFEDALAGSERAGPARSATWSASIVPGRLTRSEQHGADVVVDRSRRAAGPAVIKQPEFSLEPWSLRETALDLDRLAQTESVFALSNGHVGWRGNLDEGEPHGLPGSYLNGVYELRPLPYSEAAYGRPESSADRHQRHERQAHPAVRRRRAVRRAVRRRCCRTSGCSISGPACSPAGPSGCRRRAASVRVSSTRLVSFTHRAIAADQLRGRAGRRRACGSPCSPSCSPTSSCPPRAGIRGRGGGARPSAAAASSTPRMSTRSSSCTGPPGSGLRVGAGDGPPSRGARRRADGVALLSPTAAWSPRPRSCSQVSGCAWSSSSAYGWSGARSLPAVRDQVWAALSGARLAGWDGLVAEQRAYLDDFWDRADVEVDGDIEIQQAVRFGLFHVLQAGARGEDRPIPAKGLTGPGYDGHAFWDTETFVLPVLTLTAPDAAASALRWRHSTLPAARRARRAARLRRVRPSRGGRSPGRSARVTGPPAPPPSTSTPTSPTRRSATSTPPATRTSRRTRAWSCSSQTARLWRSLGHHDGEGRFHIDGVTGPDEYSAIADDNVYTNLMAQPESHRRRRRAAEKYPDRARELGVDAEEAAQLARRRRGHVHSLRRGARRAPAGRGLHRGIRCGTSPGPRRTTTRCCCTTRTSTCTASRSSSRPTWCWPCTCAGEAFTAEQKARNFDYYEALTVRDSSLSACTQAVIAAEVGHLDLAFDYLGEAALMDLRRPGAQHPRRRAHRVAGRDLGGPDRRLRRPASRRWHGRRFAPRLPGGHHAAGVHAS